MSAYPPCRNACPAGVNVQAYIALISRGKFKEAFKVIRKHIPLPAVCGRVCFAPCEDACTRKDIDNPLSIRALKRLAADFELKMEGGEKPSPLPRNYDSKIAIIGSGPAGLSAAYELIKMGYPVTVFEKSSAPGGMLRECIPEYRLPKQVLDIEIQYLVGLGLEIKTSMALGKDFTMQDLFKEGYKAVFIAIGAQKSLSLNCEGENLVGVIHALDFLRDVNFRRHVDVGNRVAVIGGGNVAIDAARTARRLGFKEVTVIYRRSENEMPAHRKEVEEAQSEGVKFLFLTAPTRFIGENGRLVSIECLKVGLGQPDETGRRRPIPIQGSEFIVPIDMVILAIGETLDTSSLPKEIEIAKGNTITVDPITLETKIPGVFAGGDAVTGPASVIEAIAAGKRAAISINRYINGFDFKTGREEKFSETKWVKDAVFLERKPRQPASSLDFSPCLGGFQEVELGFDAETGIIEAQRCLFCGPCEQCLEREDLCESDDALVDEDKCIGCANCEKICGYGAIKVEKSVAKVNYELCKGCGTCAVECPAMSISMSNFTNEKISASIKNAQKTWRSDEPRILAFICYWCHSVDIKQLEEHLNTHMIQVKCTGRIDPMQILQAFWNADGVLIIGCSSKDCHYVFGASIVEKRVEEVKKWLEAVGIEPERLQIIRASAAYELTLNKIIANFTVELKQLRVNPLMH